MHKRRLGHSFFLLGAFLLLASISILSPASEVIVRAFGNSDIITLTNTERSLLSLSELKTNTQLTSAAQAKADDMARQQFFAHVAPDGTMAWDYIKKAGYTYDVAGENLAITNESAETVMKSWMNSPSHRENITNTEYQDIGIGIAQYGDYQGHKNTTVIVALYAKSGAVQVIGAPTNPAGGAAVLQPKYTILPPAVLITGAIALIVVGASLELRHIRRLHHKLN
jgi:uncharacterized protein YkwD